MVDARRFLNYIGAEPNVSTPTGPSYTTSTGTTVIRLEGTQGRSRRSRRSSSSRSSGSSQSSQTNVITQDTTTNTPATTVTEGVPSPSVTGPRDTPYTTAGTSANLQTLTNRSQTMTDPTKQSYTTVGTQVNVQTLRNQQTRMTTNPDITPAQEARIKNLERDTQAQKTRQETIDPGLRRTQELARFVTGGQVSGPGGYEQRSWAGKTAENLAAAGLAGPIMLGRGIATAGEKVVLLVRAATTGSAVRDEVRNEFVEAFKRDEFKRTFDIRTPEGFTTYAAAGLGAGFFAAGAGVSSAARSPRVVGGTYTQTVSRSPGGTITRGVIEGTITTRRGSAPFSREYLATESGATGVTTIRGTTTSAGRTISDTGRGTTFRSQFPETTQSGGGSIRSSTRPFRSSSTDTFSTTRYGEVTGGISQGRTFRGYQGASSQGRFIVDQGPASTRGAFLSNYKVNYRLAYQDTIAPTIKAGQARLNQIRDLTVNPKNTAQQTRLRIIDAEKFVLRARKKIAETPDSQFGDASFPAMVEGVRYRASSVIDSGVSRVGSTRAATTVRRMFGSKKGEADITPDTISMFRSGDWTGGTGAAPSPSPVIGRTGTTSSTVVSSTSPLSVVTQANIAAQSLAPRSPVGLSPTSMFSPAGRIITPNYELPAPVVSELSRGQSYQAVPRPVPRDRYGPDFTRRELEPIIRPISQELSPSQSELTPLYIGGVRGDSTGRSGVGGRTRSGSDTGADVGDDGGTDTGGDFIPDIDPVTDFGGRSRGRSSPVPIIGGLVPPVVRTGGFIRPTPFFFAPDISFGGGGSGGFGGFARPSRQPTGYTPSLYATVAGITAEDVDPLAIKSGLGIRPIIRRRKGSRGWLDI